MFSSIWIFIGFLTGMLVVAVFVPPARKETNLPTPNDNLKYHTESGCVKFKTQEVACTPKTTSLNFIASQQ